MASPGNNKTTTSPRTPVYFLGIGGPNFIDNTNHPAYHQLVSTGHEITHAVRPKAIVVLSAHWQHPGPSSNRVAVNVAEDGELIYDFYGFPPHFYEQRFPHRGSPELAGRVVELLERKGIEAERVHRGLDHGVWVGFLAAFNPTTNPLTIPMVQISLLSSSSPTEHYTLGEALAPLRNEGILIIGAGMAVHNLQDFRKALSSGAATGVNGKTAPLPYATSFEAALVEAISVPDAEARKEAMATLLARADARHAHPTREHILPMHVAAGAAGEDPGTRIWALAEGSLNWGQYRFGEVEAA